MLLDKYPIFQQAYLVNDLEEAAIKWNKIFGAGPFVFSPHHKCDKFEYRGTPQEADVSYAFGYVGDMMIQFIEQHDETPSIYRDMYQNGEEGYHHIGVLVTDFDKELDKLLSHGFELACRLYADGVDAAYVDTREFNGVFTELHGDPNHILGEFARWKRAHEKSKPGDDIHLKRVKIND